MGIIQLHTVPNFFPSIRHYFKNYVLGANKVYTYKC